MKKKVRKSFRFEPEVVDIIKSKCNGNQTKFVQDCIKNAVEMKLNGHKTDSIEDEILNCDCCDDLSKQTLMKIIKNIHSSDNSGLDEDDYGRPLSAEINWNYDED